jgi:hypothetical protein
MLRASDAKASSTRSRGADNYDVLNHLLYGARPEHHRDSGGDMNDL